MAKENFGMVDWDQPKFGKSTKEDSKVEFMKLANGVNKLRLLTKPFQYDTWLGFKPTENIPEGRNKYGERLLSSIFHGKDPLMEAPWNLERPTRRWLCGIIDLNTSSYKILDLSSSIFKKLQNLNKIKGDVTSYDIAIVKDTNQPPASYYDVLPLDTRPLTGAEIELREGIDYDDLKRRVQPPTYDQVKDRLDKILVLWGVSAQNKTPKIGNSAAKGGDIEAADDDTDFPSA